MLVNPRLERHSGIRGRNGDGAVARGRQLPGGWFPPNAIATRLLPRAAWVDTSYLEARLVAGTCKFVGPRTSFWAGWEWRREVYNGVAAYSGLSATSH